MKLNHITIPSLDLTKSIPFYEKLGLTMIVQSMPHYARFTCVTGDATFSIHQTDQLPKGSNGVWVYFECDHLDTYVEELEKKGIQFDELPNDKPWLWREAWLYDPDGNKLILYEAGENRLNPPWKIKHQE